MFKKILIIISVIAVAAYLVIAMTQINLHSKGERCKKVEVIIKDTSDIDLLTKTGVISTLQRKGIKLKGKEMSEINTKSLEIQSQSFPLVRDVECYKTLGGKVRFLITQRMPVLHVIDDAGGDYYIDDIGQFIPSDPKVIAYRPIVTGNVNKWFATNFLYKLGVYIYYNPFWRALIQQINVLPGWNIELVPRIGNHIIYLGSMENFESKLDRLKLFYEKGLKRVGWNKYSRISLEFNNQIICTKRICETMNDSIQ